MKFVLASVVVFVLLLQSCDKEKKQSGCDIHKTYEDNASKVSIKNGIWGTVAFTEGNCMPMIEPTTSTCKTCPVKRTIRIYEYTKVAQAMPQEGTDFYDTFTTTLIKELDTDDKGFFQTDLPTGNYTVVIMENGKLYAPYLDGQGGISPVQVTGGRQNTNLSLTYKAAF